MMGVGIAALREALEKIARELIASKELLTHIDNLTGDGDLGISMEKGGYSILQELEKQEGDGIAGLLLRCAIAVNRDAPSTMGTLSSLSIMEVAKLMKGKEQFGTFDLLRIPDCMVNIITIRGRAQLGDKTVLDALIPYSRKLTEVYESQGSMPEAILAAAEEAAAAANATKGKLAKIGRAKWIGERSRNCPDGGAVVCAIVANAIIDRAVTFDVPGMQDTVR